MDEFQPTPDAVLDALVALLATVPGLVVVAGLPYKVPALPCCYAVLEGVRYDASAQTLTPRHAYLVRVLVAWQDRWETSERALNPFVHALPRLLLSQDALGPAFVDAASLRLDSSERGDGVVTINETSYRSFALRFEVTL